MGWLLFLAICALMTGAWFFGRSVGYDDGYDDGYAEGYFNGDQDAAAKWRPAGSVRPVDPER